MLTPAPHLDEPVPAYLQRYRCSQCPDECQPPDGYGLSDFHAHVFEHTQAALRASAADAVRLLGWFQKIESEVCSGAGGKWPAFALMRYLRIIVAYALHPHNEALHAEIQRETECAAGICTACGQPEPEHTR